MDCKIQADRLELLVRFIDISDYIPYPACMSDASDVCQQERSGFCSFRFVGERPCISIRVLLAFFIFPFCQLRAALNPWIYCRITSYIYPVLGGGNDSRVPPYVLENAKRRGSSVTGLTSEGVNPSLTVPIHW
jgi:hypothetical protein